MNNNLNELADVLEDEVALGETLCGSRTKVLRVCSCKRIRRVPSASGRRRRCCKAKSSYHEYSFHIIAGGSGAQSAAADNSNHRT
jgi:hypothetical protein